MLSVNDKRVICFTFLIITFLLTVALATLIFGRVAILTSVAIVWLYLLLKAMVYLEDHRH